MNKILILIVALTCAYSQSVSAQLDFFGNKKEKLKAYDRIEKSARKEVSGMVMSKNNKEVFWIHGDSGTKNKIYAINKNGKLVGEKGLLLKGIENIDWEDITTDDEGNIIVADIGNNCKCRTDLSLIVVSDANEELSETEDFKVLRIEYPKKESILKLVGKPIPNAEAIFYLDGIYILTKEGKGKNTELYKLENPDFSKVNTLVKKETFDFGNKVTAADVSPDKKLLAVLMDKSLRVFEINAPSSFFQKEVFSAKFKADQVESVAFESNNSVIIAEEKGQLYRIKLF